MNKNDTEEYKARSLPTDSTPRSYKYEAARLLNTWAYAWHRMLENGPTPAALLPDQIVQRLLELQEFIENETLCPACHTDAPKVCSVCLYGDNSLQ